MHIVVCVKRIPDPEPSAVPFKIDRKQHSRANVDGLKLVISPYDEQCLEAALQLRDVHGEDEVQITALCMGNEDDRKGFKELFAMGANEGVLLVDPLFKGADGFVTARILAAAIAKLPPADLVLTGRMAADFDEGVVGYALSELLNRPMLPCAAKIDVECGQVLVKRIVEDGYDLIEAALPAIVSVTNELGDPRRPGMRQLMRAGRMKPVVWGAVDLELSADQIGSEAAILDRIGLTVPEVQKSCEMLQGETSTELVEQLIGRLHEARILA